LNALPIFIDLTNQAVAVVGAGTSAARRSELALRAGAQVRVYAPSLGDDFHDLAGHERLTHVTRDPTGDDLAGCRIVFCATGDLAADTRVADLARRARCLVNVADNPDLCDFIMPSIVDRSPLLIAISTGGASPVFARLIRARLESTIPASYGKLVEFVARYRDQINRRIRDSVGRRRFWERLLEGPIADRVIDGNEAAATVEMERALAETRSPDEPEARGEVYLVGAGPGDPDLLTFRALRLMQRADVVLHDRLIGDGLINLVRRDAERIYVGKLPQDHTLPQDQIGALMVKLAREGKRVLRLKGGDPFMFGRGGEEIEMLAEAGIPFQVVPGVTAANGCAAYAGIPLTHRDHAQACVFVTGHGRNGKTDVDWNLLLQPHHTVAIFMGLGQLGELMAEYIARGGSPDLPVAVVDNGTRPNQRVVTGTLATIATLVGEAGLKGPAMIIVGTVVTLRDKLRPDDINRRPG
jgi:uroporphyrin-III C-methyltransferase/precorrin-2 dehydrogenase/sirohydrochlorin ferrochelatase